MKDTQVVTFRKMVDKGILNMDDLRLVWKSKLIPNGPVVVKKDMPDEMVKVLIGFIKTIRNVC